MATNDQGEGGKPARAAPLVERGRRALAESKKAFTGTGEGDRFRRLVAFAMVGVSMFGAFVSYQASKASQRAGGLDQQATQEQLVVEQSRTSADLTVADDLRLLGPFEEAVLGAQALQSAARRARGDDPASVRRLEAEYSRTLRETETLSRFFVLPPQVSLDPTRIDYDPVRASFLAENFFDPRFQALRPAATRVAAEREHQRSVEYTRAAALLVGALFFFTLAQLIDAHRRRWLMAVAGGVVSLAAVAQFFVAV